MKYIYLFLVLISFLLSACSDIFLYQKPKGQLSEENLSDPQAIEGICIAAYSALAGPEDVEHAFLAPTTNWIYGEVRAETAYKGGGGIGDIWEFNAFETFRGVFSSNGLLDRKWFDLYISVQRCNAAIRALNVISEETMPLRTVRLGEMRFLRAHFYFELSHLFNKIPYFDENVAEEDYIKIPNDEFSRDEILEKIAAEFIASAQLLPAKQPEVGRVNKYAAYAYAAKVNLYRAYKQNPDNNQFTGKPDAALLEKVVEYCDSVARGGYDLLKDFQQLDLVEYENSVESVFAVQYSIDDGTTYGRINWSNLLNMPRGPAYGGDGFFQPSQNLVNSYKTSNDGLPRFDDYNSTRDIITVANAASFKLDPRLDFTVGRPGVTWKTYKDFAYAADWVRDYATYGPFACKRFCVSPESPYMVKGWPWGGSALNWQIIRYAHVLLWKAEALIELGRQNEALPLINKIRERAKNSAYVQRFNATGDAANYLIDIYKDGENCTWTQDYARMALRFESKLEKAMEGERFFDLVRWGVAAEVLNNEFFPKEKLSRTYYDQSEFVSGRDEYFPIPQAQINFSGNLYKQNPGYELSAEE